MDVSLLNSARSNSTISLASSTISDSSPVTHCDSASSSPYANRSRSTTWASHYGSISSSATSPDSILSFDCYSSAGAQRTSRSRAASFADPYPSLRHSNSADGSMPPHCAPNPLSEVDWSSWAAQTAWHQINVMEEVAYSPATVPSTLFRPPMDRKGSDSGLLAQSFAGKMTMEQPNSQLIATKALEDIVAEIQGARSNQQGDRCRQLFVQTWLQNNYLACPDGHVPRQGRLVAIYCLGHSSFVHLCSSVCYLCLCLSIIRYQRAELCFVR